MHGGGYVLVTTWKKMSLDFTALMRNLQSRDFLPRLSTGSCFPRVCRVDSRGFLLILQLKLVRVCSLTFPNRCMFFLFNTPDTGPLYYFQNQLWPISPPPFFFGWLLVSELCFACHVSNFQTFFGFWNFDPALGTCLSVLNCLPNSRTLSSPTYSDVFCFFFRKARLNYNGVDCTAYLELNSLGIDPCSHNRGMVNGSDWLLFFFFY